MTNEEITKLKLSIEFELADLQCLLSCAERGFSLQDWIDSKAEVLEFMKNRLARGEE